MPGPATSASLEPVRLGLITWDDDSPTGGNVYNTALVGALRGIGVDAELVRVGSSWPDGGSADRAQLRTSLLRWPVALVDGIVAGTAADEIDVARRHSREVSVLVHLPLADESGLPGDVARGYLGAERAALAAARTVICPSRWLATRIAERYGRPDAVVARPGAQPSAVAAGSLPPRLLCLGALTPTKNQLALLAALDGLGDVSWTASIVGSPLADPDYAEAVVRAAARLGDRVSVTGPLSGRALARAWATIDLLVLCSRVETYGLVVAEALSHGIPAVVPARTGAVDALGEVDGLPPGRAVEPAELAPTLRGWLSDAGLRAEWRRRALLRRPTLSGWQDTARIVRRALFARPEQAL